MRGPLFATALLLFLSAVLPTSLDVLAEVEGSGGFKESGGFKGSGKVKELGELENSEI